VDKPVRMLLGDYPLTQALKKGEVKSGTVNLEFADVKTVSTAFKAWCATWNSIAPSSR